MPAVSQGAGAVPVTVPSAPPPPPSSGGGGAKYCFEWGGQKWGKDYPGWTKFKAWLAAHGANANDWIDAHPSAAKCIGAKKTGESASPPPPTPGTGSEPPPPGSTGTGSVQFQFSHSDLERLWQNAGGPGGHIADIAAAIAQAESNGCKYALAGPADIRPKPLCTWNRTSKENSCGLWQINLYAHKSYSAPDIFDENANAAAAVAISKSGSSFAAWTTFTSGAYKKYLTGTGGTGGSSGTGGGGGNVQPPAGVVNGWRNVVGFYKTTVPAENAKVAAVVSQIKGVFT